MNGQLGLVRETDLMKEELVIIYVKGEPEGNTEEIDEFMLISAWPAVVALGIAGAALLWEVGKYVFEKSTEDEQRPEVNVSVTCQCDCSPVDSPSTDAPSTDTSSSGTLSTDTSSSSTPSTDTSSSSTPSTDTSSSSTPSTDTSSSSIPSTTEPGDYFTPETGGQTSEFDTTVKFSEPDGSETLPSNAEMRYWKIRKDMTDMTFDSVEAEVGYLKHEMEQAGIKIRVSRTGPATVVDAGTADPAGVASQLRRRGIKDQRLIQQCVGEANATISNAEDFVRHLQAEPSRRVDGGEAHSLPLPLRTSSLAEDFATLAAEWDTLVSSGFADQLSKVGTDGLAHDAPLYTEIQSPSGIVTRVALMTKTRLVEDSDLEPGVYPAAFVSVFDEATWQSKA